MAEMTKKLHFLKSGTEQTAKAYSTTSESGSSYITNVIDNTTCYVPLVGASDSRATYGRVLKSGTTYAIASSGKPVYTEKSWTSAGSYTFTVPAGVTRVRVACCGGGGGSVIVAVAGREGTWYGGVGGASSFGSLMKTTPPSKGAYLTRTVDTSGEYNDYNVNGSSTSGSPNGRKGKNSWGNKTISGGTGYALSFTLTNGSYGQGGGASGDSSSYYMSSGGSGGYNSGYVNVSAGSTYTIKVGAGGSGNNTTGYSSFKAHSGNSGFVLIAYGGDI